jgi:N-acetylglucosamine kinase-like BadF-type ATPase
MGRQIIRAVMRGYDGRQIKTALRNPVLDIMGAKDELELMRILRKGEQEDQILDLVPILFEAAYEGDEVAQSLIIFLGEEVALTATTIIHRLGLHEEEVPVVLSTSVYQGKGPLFLDIIIANLHRVAPKAKVITPIFIPVVGAVFEAMSAKGVICNNKCLAHLKKSLIQSHPYLLQNEYFHDA